MINSTLHKIQDLVHQSNRLTDDQRSELLDLVDKLKQELEAVSADDTDRAASIAGYTKMAAHECLRSEQDPELQALSEKALIRAIEDFEVSHPKLYDTAKSICISLSALGI